MSIVRTEGGVETTQWPNALGGPAAAQARILERLRTLVEQESPSGDVAQVSALALEVAAMLETAGLEVDRIEAPGYGINLRARLEGAEPELEPVVVLAHLDTVHPVGTLERQPFRVVGDRAEGPGIYDMKAGIAVLVDVLDRMHRAGERPRRPLRVVVTCDEEIGSNSSRALIESEARGARAVLVPEPSLPGGAAKTARKGVATYELLIQGRAAHAGVEPERGASAIAELAHQILAVLALADPARGTTVNVGVVSGGTASNVVAAEARAEIDVRLAVMEEAARVDAAMRALRPVTPGVSIDVRGGVNRPPLERTDAVVELYRHARALAAGLGVDLGEGSTGGASDGCFTAALGVPTLDGLGPRGGGAHSTDEHIIVSDLPFRAALFARLFQTL